MGPARGVESVSTSEYAPGSLGWVVTEPQRQQAARRRRDAEALVAAVIRPILYGLNAHGDEDAADAVAAIVRFGNLDLPGRVDQLLHPPQGLTGIDGALMQQRLRQG